MRKSRKSRARNISDRVTFKNARRDVLLALQAGKIDAALISKAVSAIGRAAAHGSLPRNTAARLISRLQRKVNSVAKK